MSKWLTSSFLLYGAFNFAAAQFSFQTHYLPLGQPESSSKAIALDSSGNVFVVSNTSAGIRTTKTDPLGNILLSLDFGAGVTANGATVDPEGNLLVVGTRQGGPSPIIGSYSETSIFKLDNDLRQVLATATLGNRATGTTGGNAVTTDGSGNIYVTGSTSATDFPVTPGAYQTTGPPHISFYYPAVYSFVTKLTSDLTTITYSTYFGTPSQDCQLDVCLSGATTWGTGIAVDSAGVVALAGFTNGPGLGGGGAFRQFQWPNFGFVARFRPDLGDLLGIAKLGMAGGDEIRSLCLDSKGHILVSGGNAADGLPFGPNALEPHGPTCRTCTAGFLAEYDSDLNLLWGTYFGPPGPVTAAFDAQDNIWVTGAADTSTLPTTATLSAGFRGFIAKLTQDGSAVSYLALAPVGTGTIATNGAGSIAFLGYPPLFLNIFLTLGPPDRPSFLTVDNSAYEGSPGMIAPLELVSLYGTGIGPVTAVEGQIVNGAVTNSLGGYQVLFNGIAAPILYAGPNQINVVSPQAIAGQESADIDVVGPQGSTAFPTVFVVPARPQIFLRPGTTSDALALNQDGTLNSATNGAVSGSTVTIWATGTGLTNDGLMDGSIVPPPGSSDLVLPLSFNLAVSSSFRGQTTYAGNAPGAVLGLTQISFIWPGSTSRIQVYIQAGDATSAAPYVYGQ